MSIELQSMDVNETVVPILQYVSWSGGIGMLRSIAKYVRKPENAETDLHLLRIIYEQQY